MGVYNALTDINEPFCTDESYSEQIQEWPWWFI
jgi:hypothetical protein